MPSSATSSVSSLKERGRVKRGFAGLLPVFTAVAGMPDWPAGLVGAAWGLACPVPRLLPIRVSGSVRVKDRAEPGRREPAPQASLTRRAASR